MTELLLEYKYLFLFIGMLIGGETIFLPAAYLVYIGTLNFFPVIGISILGSAISDAFWYFLGRVMPMHPFIKRRLHREESIFRKISDLFDRNSSYCLFLSKFVYGTRTITQILCGIRRISFPKYFIVNFISIIFYLLSIFGLILVIGGSLKKVEDGFHTVHLVFALIVLVFIVIHVWIRKMLKRS